MTHIATGWKEWGPLIPDGFYALPHFEEADGDRGSIQRVFFQWEEGQAYAVNITSQGALVFVFVFSTQRV